MAAIADGLDPTRFAGVPGRHGRALRQAVLWMGGLLFFVITLWLIIKFLPERLASTNGITDASSRAQEIGRTRTAILAVLAGILAAIGAYYTHRTFGLKRHGQVTERFTRAVDQLGNDSIHVRLGGIYALERLAREAPDDHGPIVEILTAYVRERAGRRPPAPPADDAPAPADNAPPLPRSQPAGRGPATDVQAVLTVLGRRTISHDPPSPWRLELSRVDLRGIRLRHARLERVNLSDADLENADLEGARLENADLLRANLRWANLYTSHLENAQLGLALIDAVDLRSAYLQGTRLTGARLETADLRGAHLEQADLSGAYLERADVSDAHLQGASLMRANLRGAASTAHIWKAPTFAMLVSQARTSTESATRRTRYGRRALTWHRLRYDTAITGAFQARSSFVNDVSDFSRCDERRRQRWPVPKG